MNRVISSSVAGIEPLTLPASIVQKSARRTENLAMSDEKIRKSLDELRSELARLEAEEAQVRERLDALIAGVETRLDRPGDASQDQSLVEDLRQSISQFEVSHPRATAILNDIMVALGNLGI